MDGIFHYYFGLFVAVAGAFYAGYQRGSRIQAVKDTASRVALIKIVERLGDEQLSSLGRDIRDTALKGLK